MPERLSFEGRSLWYNFGEIGSKRISFAAAELAGAQPERAISLRAKCLLCPKRRARVPTSAPGRPSTLTPLSQHALAAVRTAHRAGLAPGYLLTGFLGAHYSIFTFFTEGMTYGRLLCRCGSSYANGDCATIGAQALCAVPPRQPLSNPTTCVAGRYLMSFSKNEPHQGYVHPFNSANSAQARQEA